MSNSSIQCAGRPIAGTVTSTSSHQPLIAISRSSSSSGRPRSSRSGATVPSTCATTVRDHDHSPSAIVVPAAVYQVMSAGVK